MCQNVKRSWTCRTIFSKNVAVTEISTQIIEVLSFCDRESLTSFNKTNLVNFLVKKQNKKTVNLSGMNFLFENTRTNYKFYLVLVLKFKGFNSA